MLSAPSSPLARVDATHSVLRMKRVTYADKTLLMGTDAAEALMEYARVLAQAASADAVTLRCLSTDGDAVQATFLLHAHTALLVESTYSDVGAPDNTEAVIELRDRIDRTRRPVSGGEEETPWSAASEDLGDL